MLGVVGVVELGVVCVRDQVTPWAFRSLVRTAKKGCFSFVGTAAVVGVRVTLMPESMKSETAPVLAVFATDCAVIMIVSAGNLVGSGRTDGAVKVAVPVVCWLESVPREPSVGQAIGVEGFGFGVAVVAGGVVVYMHGCQLTFVLVEPTTVAVSVVDWPKMRTLLATDDTTDTVITMAPLLLLPHPPKNKQGAMTASVR